MEVQYQLSSVSERLHPEIAYSSQKKVSALMLDRSTHVRFPKSGSSSLNITPTSTPTLEFELSYTPEFLDPSSAYLVMDVQLTYNANANGDDPANADQVLISDSVLPWFSLCQTYLSGVLLESLNDADLYAFWATWWGQSRDNYQTKGTFANRLWRWGERTRTFEDGNPDLTVSFGFPSNANYTAGQDASIDWLPESGVSALSRVQTVVVPLSMLALFSSKTYLPPQVGGSINLRFYTQSIAKMFATSGITITNVSLSNISLYFDTVKCADEVLAFIQSMSQSAPVHLPIYHTRVQVDQSQLVGTGAVLQQVNLNLSTSNLISTFHYFLEANQRDGTEGLYYMKNPCFGQTSAGQDQVYLELGSKTYPSQARTNGVGSFYMELTKALGDIPHCPEAIYYFLVQPSSTVGEKSSAFCIGFNTEKIIGACSDGSVSGVNTRSVAGQLRLFLKGSDATAQSAVAGDQIVSVMKYMEYIIISGSGITTTNV